MALQSTTTSRRGVSTTLTAEVFRDVIGALRSDESSTRLLDKRTSPRVGLRTKLAIVTGPAGPFDAPLPRRQGPPLRVLYEVAHCKRLAKDLFSIGAKLTRIMA